MNTSPNRKKGTENNSAAVSLLAISEACRFLHVHRNTLMRWSKLGIIKTYSFGPRREIGFRRDDLEALLVEEKSGDKRFQKSKLK